MISYHPGSATAPIGQHFTHGFVAVETDCPERIAKCMAKYAWSPAKFEGGYRKRENFVEANWLGLDFESPEFSLAEAERSFVDMIHVIGTTRNHQVMKAGEKIDRFRVLLKAERPMTGPELLATLKHLERKYPVDASCVDIARHFFPCREVTSVMADGYVQEIIPPPRPPTREELIRADIRAKRAKARFEKNGVMPHWVKAFLERGQLCRGGGRNNTIYAVAVALSELGLTAPDIAGLVANAPFNREDITARAVEQTIHSALRRKS